MLEPVKIPNVKHKILTEGAKMLSKSPMAAKIDPISATILQPKTFAKLLAIGPSSMEIQILKFQIFNFGNSDLKIWKFRFENLRISSFKVFQIRK